MSIKCKLFYQIDPPFSADLPVRSTVKRALGQRREILDQVEDYGQVTYHSDSALPYIKNVKGRTLDDTMLPTDIPDRWKPLLPDILGFHMHENCELTLITAGRMLYIVDGTCVEASAGDLVFFGSYIPHAWIIDPTTPVNLVELSFKPDIPNQFTVSSHAISAHSILSRIVSGTPKYLYLPQAGEIDRRMHQVAAELEKREYGYRVAATLELNLILLGLLRRFGVSPERTESSQTQVIRKAREYIAEHLAENPGLSQIAAAVFVTPHYLSFLFKKQVGIGLSDYMNQQKLLRTVELLTDSDLSVLDIALQSGFTSKSNFYRVFKEYYGITPQQMRDALVDQPKSEPTALSTTEEPV